MIKFLIEFECGQVEFLRCCTKRHEASSVEWRKFDASLPQKYVPTTDWVDGCGDDVSSSLMWKLHHEINQVRYLIQRWVPTTRIARSLASSSVR